MADLDSKILDTKERIDILDNIGGWLLLVVTLPVALALIRPVYLEHSFFANGLYVLLCITTALFCLRVRMVFCIRHLVKDLEGLNRVFCVPELKKSARDGLRSSLGILIFSASMVTGYSSLSDSIEKNLESEQSISKLRKEVRGLRKEVRDIKNR